MEIDPAERAVLERVYEKARVAGALRVGYLLRRAAITAASEWHPGLDLDQGIDRLVGRGLLLPTPSGAHVVLSESGVSLLDQLF